MTPSDLKTKVEATGSKFFTRETMKFFGDTMSNYGVREATVSTWTQTDIPVYELYRRRPVKHGLFSSCYFNRETFDRVYAKGE